MFGVRSSAVETHQIMNLYYVYILKCADGLTYTGITENIARRLKEHQGGTIKTAFTYRRRPVQLIFLQEFNDVLQAIYFEKKIKKWSAKKKFALASGDMDLLQILSECRNASHFKYHPDKDWGLDCARPDSTKEPQTTVLLNICVIDVNSVNCYVFNTI